MRTKRVFINQVSNTPVISTDMYPTMLSLAGLSVDEENPVDGVDLSPLLKGGELERDYLTWFMPHYMQAGEKLASSAAIRAGDYKLVKLFEGSHSLYNLKDDIGESIDLSKTEKGTAERLDGLLMKTLKAQNAFSLLRALSKGEPRRHR